MTHDVAYLNFGRDGGERPLEPHSVSSGHRERDGSDIAASWDAHGFSICVEGVEESKRLRDIYDAILKGDATLSMTGSINPFAGNGLCLVIASRLSQQTVDSALQKDLAHQRLLEAVEASGIKRELESAGCRYFALSPKWTNSTETELTFFLNPQGQHKFNHGWFSLQDLRAWINGSGPIVKDQSAHKARPRG